MPRIVSLLRGKRTPRPLAMRTVLPLVSLVLFAGCAQWPTVAPPPRAESVVKQMKRFEGRMTLLAPDRAAVSLRFAMVLDGASGELQLSDALGLTSANAKWDTTGARVQRGSLTRRYDSFADMSQNLLGQPLPETALPSWMQGKPSVPTTQQTPDGFTELGWRVQRLGNSGQSRLLEFSREAEPQRRLRIAVEAAF